MKGEREGEKEEWKGDREGGRGDLNMPSTVRM